MTNEEKKLKKGDYLQEVIKRCLESEPKLTYDDLAFVILEHIDSKKFVSSIKRELKNKF